MGDKAGVPADSRACTSAGSCTCNCCDKRARKHCGSHNSGCHDSCSYKF